MYTKYDICKVIFDKIMTEKQGFKTNEFKQHLYLSNEQFKDFCIKLNIDYEKDELTNEDCFNIASVVNSNEDIKTFNSVAAMKYFGDKIKKDKKLDVVKKKPVKSTSKLDTFAKKAKEVSIQMKEFKKDLYEGWVSARDIVDKQKLKWQNFENTIKPYVEKYPDHFTITSKKVKFGTNFKTKKEVTDYLIEPKLATEISLNAKNEVALEGKKKMVEATYQISESYQKLLDNLSQYDYPEFFQKVDRIDKKVISVETDVEVMNKRINDLEKENQNLYLTIEDYQGKDKTKKRKEMAEVVTNMYLKKDYSVKIRETVLKLYPNKHYFSSLAKLNTIINDGYNEKIPKLGDCDGRQKEIFYQRLQKML